MKSKTMTSTLALMEMASATFGVATPAAAQIDPFIGQIMTFGGNFCPRGWSTTDGQLLPISQNTALFSILGTTYGGDGRTTFALPDLRGRVKVGPGQGPGLTFHPLGQKFGSETRNLTVAEMPMHSHTAVLHAESAPGTTGNPTGNLLGVNTADADPYALPNPAAEVAMSTDSIRVSNTGGSQPFDIMQPSLAITTCIALVGIFPSRN